jgi:hypothetical protein
METVAGVETETGTGEGCAYTKDTFVTGAGSYFGAFAPLNACERRLLNNE